MKSWIKQLRAHRYGFGLFAFMTAAVLTGVACVYFARLFDAVVQHRLDFDSVGSWAWVLTPVGFLVAVELIRRTAKYAAGTGIPQAIYASENLIPAQEAEVLPLVSMRTMTLKMITLLLGVWVGASTGREGPTVHIAVCIFIGILLLFRRWTGIAFDLRSAAIAGGSAGLAAAFNTPLAGVTFAVEELSGNYFGAVKDVVLMAIIVAAITAQSLTGEYGYFGKLMEPASVPLFGIVLIGVVAGGLGACFSSLLLRGARFLKRFERGLARYGVPLIMAVCLLGVTVFFGTRVLGPGNQVAQQLLRAEYGGWVIFFPLAKMAATLFTYWSGIAGGIFAPCLSIGAAVGSSLGQVLQESLGSCALLGMAAFLSGTIQAPITAFVIIFEMTGHHQMLLPIMLASLIAFMVARIFGAAHLYQTLAENYRPVSQS